MVDLDQLLGLLASGPFAAAGESALRELAPLFVSRRYEKGALVFLEGDMEGRLFLVKSGCLRAFRNLPGGRILTVFTLVAGDFFGFLPLLDGGPYPVSVAAVAPAQVFALSRDDFVRAVTADPKLSLMLLAYTARRLRSSLDQVGRLGNHGAASRIARVFLDLLPLGAGQSGCTEVLLPCSQAELGRTLGVAAENVSRALARLSRDGAIKRTGRGRFRLCDVAALSRVAGTD